MIYWDTSCIVRFLVQDPGWQTVSQLADTDEIACSRHGEVETVAAFHRKLREARLSPNQFAAIINTFAQECKNGGYHWLSITPAVVERAQKVYSSLPATTALRAGDALHLACAAENGFKEIYSNDKHLLNAASHFGLIGKNVI